MKKYFVLACLMIVGVACFAGDFLVYQSNFKMNRFRQETQKGEWMFDKKPTN